MAIQNQFRTWALKATEDLDSVVAGTGALYKAVANATGKLANTGLAAVGLLQYAGKNTEHITIGTDGIMKFVAGEALATKDTRLTVTTSGYMIAATEGDYVVGRNLIAATSGSVHEGIFDFTAPHLYQAAVANQEFTAQSDLSSTLNKFVDMANGVVATASTAAQCVLTTGTTSGGTCEGIVDGKVDVKAGGVITVGQSLKASTGFAIQGNSGDLLIARAVEASAAGNSGSTFACVLNLATPHYATNCFDVMY